jgi:uncharacterized lipoprotein
MKSHVLAILLATAVIPLAGCSTTGANPQATAANNHHNFNHALFYGLHTL